MQGFVYLKACYTSPYKLPEEKWQLRPDTDKPFVKEQKKTIQEKFKSETGLIIDLPIAVFGYTNDAMMVIPVESFLLTELAAEITGVDVNLIYRLKVILEIKWPQSAPA